MARDAHGWRQRLEQLAALEAGWLEDPEQPSQALDKEGLHRLRPVLEALFAFIPAPRIFLWVTGTLSLEWHEDDGVVDWFPTAEVFPESASLRAELHSFRHDDMKVDATLDVDLATAAGRALFIDFILSQMPKALPVSTA